MTELNTAGHCRFVSHIKATFVASVNHHEQALAACSEALVLVMVAARTLCDVCNKITKHCPINFLSHN
jgi:hypothetical protein